jgi:hypothetical protein
VTVTFRHVSDYRDELALDVEKIERRIVRLETVREFRTKLPNISTIVVRSTARIAGEVVSLEHVCGDHWGGGFEDANKSTNEIRSNVEASIAEFCKEHDLEVRGGRLE